MSDLPKIYGTCPAGCLWETVHRSEFEKSASLIRQYPQEDGSFLLEVGKEYKAVDEQINNSFSVTLDAVVEHRNGTILEYTLLDIPQNPDMFSNTFTVKVLGLADVDGVTSIIYEFCGVRYSHPTSNIIGILELHLDWGGELYLYNSDATIKAEDGKSAYEIAVDNGFEGTEQEWLKSIEGYVLTEEDKEEIASKIESMELVPLFANNIAECTDTTKLYVLPDGYIYGYTRVESGNPEIIITREDGGYYVFYNNQYNWSEDSTYWCWHTNYIPVTAGDILKYKSGWSDEYSPDVGWFDASYNCIGTEYRKLGETEYIVPEGAVYAQFHSKGQSEDHHYLEVEWVYCQAAVATYQWASTGHAFVPADYEDEILDHEKRIKALEQGDETDESATPKASVLKGKKIVYDGDSICSSWGISTNGGSYPQIIANIVEGTFDNQGVGGGRIRTQEGSTDTFHSIVDNLVNLPTDGDLYCFEGGVNDHWHDTILGTFSESDYTGELDKTTFCGALEAIFRYAITNFVGKPICYIITHKCPYSAFSKYGTEHTFADFRKAALGICEKYSIPVYDAWKDSGINSWNASQLANYFIIDEDKGTGDGTHPNEQGYRRYYVPQLIDLFERIMPIGVTNPEQPDEPTYTNLLDTVGWTEGIYLSSGEERTDENSVTTGYIPVDFHGRIYLKNVEMPNESGHGNRIDFYREDKSYIGSVSLLTDGGQEVEYDTNGNLVYFYFYVNDTRYIRLSAWNIDETSIITFNEPIE